MSYLPSSSSNIYNSAVATASLGAAASSLTVNNITNYEFYEVDIVVEAMLAGKGLQIQLNADAGNNYSDDLTESGIEQSGASRASIRLSRQLANEQGKVYIKLWIHNLSAERKFVIFTVTIPNGADPVASGIFSITGSGVWGNTAAAISSIKLSSISGGGTDLGSGTKISVYGKAQS